MPPDVFAMERIMGVEPTTSAWEANVLPINYIRMQYNNYTTQEAVCQDLWLIFYRNYCSTTNRTELFFYTS